VPPHTQVTRAFNAAGLGERDDAGGDDFETAPAAAKKSGLLRFARNEAG
jgi:hypothetical protein